MEQEQIIDPIDGQPVIPGKCRWCNDTMDPSCTGTHLVPAELLADESKAQEDLEWLEEGMTYGG